MSRRRDKLTKSVEDRIQDLKAELSRLEEEENKLKSLSEPQQIAINLHESLCHHNHTDGCSWMYFNDFKKDTWESDHAHQEWLKRAEEFILFCEEQDISIECGLEFIEMIKGW